MFINMFGYKLNISISDDYEYIRKYVYQKKFEEELRNYNLYITYKAGVFPYL